MKAEELRNSFFSVELLQNQDVSSQWSRDAEIHALKRRVCPQSLSNRTEKQNDSQLKNDFHGCLQSENENVIVR